MTVSVNNWSEFLTAIAVPGDTVNLPNNAIWDMNEIEPEGHSGAINMECSRINGNGTRIKNLHLTGGFERSQSAKLEIHNLFLTDIIADGSKYGLFYGYIKLISCAVSGILSGSYRYLMNHNYEYWELEDHIALLGTSVYLEASGTLFQTLYSGQIKYCRVEIHAPNVNGQAQTAFGEAHYCELIGYYPNATGDFYTFNLKGCTVRGNFRSLSNEYNTSGSWSGQISIFQGDTFSDSFQRVERFIPYFIECTEEQMKNPAYLRGLGFPIVVGGD